MKNEFGYCTKSGHLVTSIKVNFYDMSEIQTRVVNKQMKNDNCQFLVF